MASDPPMDKQAGAGGGPGVVRLFAGLTIAPFAWALQVLIGYGLAAYACYPTDAALGQPLWSHLRTFVGTASVLLWILLVVGCVVAWSNWKATQHGSDAQPHQILHSGVGRSRFMALCGVAVSALFAIALLFTSVGILWVPDCGP